MIDEDVPQTASAVYRQLIDARFSCRGFLAKPVDRPTLGRILEMAQRTPSWCNTQPWRLHILSGNAAQRFSHAILEYAGKGAAVNSDLAFPVAYEGVYRERRRECGYQLYASVGIAQSDRAAAQVQAMENFKLFGAPHVAIVTTDRLLGAYGAVDCGAYLSNFALAAYSLGVAAIAQAAFAHYADFVRAYLELPDDRLILCGISFGYEDPRHPANGFRTARAPITEVATFIED
jgi:nitroreductase